MAKKKKFLPHIVTIGTSAYLVSDITTAAELIGVSYWTLKRRMKGSGCFRSGDVGVYLVPTVIKSRRNKGSATSYGRNMD